MSRENWKCRIPQSKTIFYNDTRRLSIRISLGLVKYKVYQFSYSAGLCGRFFPLPLFEILPRTIHPTYFKKSRVAPRFECKQFRDFRLHPSSTFHCYKVCYAANVGLQQILFNFLYPYFRKCVDPAFTLCRSVAFGKFFSWRTRFPRLVLRASVLPVIENKFMKKKNLSLSKKAPFRRVSRYVTDYIILSVYLSFDDGLAYTFNKHRACIQNACRYVYLRALAMKTGCLSV